MKKSHICNIIRSEHEYRRHAERISFFIKFFFYPSKIFRRIKNTIKILTTQLSNIKNFGSKIYTIDSNEILQGADGHYYSIHLQKSQFNVRLIVYINDENIPYFLCAFNERSGKNRTNYSTYTTVMKERINYFLGDDNYE